MPAIRAAVDTTVAWVGLAHPGSFASHTIDLWYEGRYDLVFTQATLEEYREVLLDPEYLARFEQFELGIRDFVELVPLCGDPAGIPEIPPPRIRDYKDRIWLEAALGGWAHYLVTTDRAFLEVDLVREMRDRGVRIVRPRNFVREMDTP